MARLTPTHASNMLCPLRSHSLTASALLLPKNNSPQLLPFATLLTHAPEDPLFFCLILSPQFLGAAKLGDFAVTQHEDAIEIGNGAQPVRNDKERGVGELLANGPLDERVGAHVHGRGGLVEDHDARAGDDGAGQAEELALALGEVQTALRDGRGEVVENVGVLGDGRGVGGVGGGDVPRGGEQVHALQTIPQLGIRVLVKGVQVRAHCAREEHGILRDNCEPRAQIVQLDLGDVQPVDVDRARARLEEAEEGQGQGGLARAGAADHADALVALHRESQALEHRGQVVRVADYQVVDFDAALGGPGGGSGFAFEGLGGKFGVLDDS